MKTPITILALLIAFAITARAAEAPKEQPPLPSEVTRAKEAAEAVAKSPQDPAAFKTAVKIIGAAREVAVAKNTTLRAKLSARFRELSKPNSKAGPRASDKIQGMIRRVDACTQALGAAHPEALGDASGDLRALSAAVSALTEAAIAHREVSAKL